MYGLAFLPFPQYLVDVPEYGRFCVTLPVENPRVNGTPDDRIISLQPVEMKNGIITKRAVSIHGFPFTLTGVVLLEPQVRIILSMHKPANDQAQRFEFEYSHETGMAVQERLVKVARLLKESAGPQLEAMYMIADKNKRGHD